MGGKADTLESVEKTKLGKVMSVPIYSEGSIIECSLGFSGSIPSFPKYPFNSSSHAVHEQEHLKHRVTLLRTCQSNDALSGIGASEPLLDHW